MLDKWQPQVMVGGISVGHWKEAVLGTWRWGNVWRSIEEMGGVDVRGSVWTRGLG